MHTKIIIKIFLLFQYIKIFLFLLNIRMINLSLHELKLIAQIRNISDYENKSKEDALNETKPKTLKTETLKTTTETKPKTTPK